MIDLTGPETRILSGYHAISGQRRPQDEWENDIRRDKTSEKLLSAQKEVFDMAELTHNINHLLETCEQVTKPFYFITDKYVELSKNRPKS